MKTKNTLIKNHRRWFSILLINLKQRLTEYNSQRMQRKNRMKLLKLGDHLLRDIGFENFNHEKRHSKK